MLGKQLRKTEIAAKTDLAGRRLSHLMVLERLPSSRWRCRCDCGDVIVVSDANLRRGQKTCIRCRRPPMERHGHTAGRRLTPEYAAWQQMKDRCHDRTNPQYHNYGGRGILVCDGWRRDFVAFLGHIGLRPGRGYSVDRINNDGNYEPGNVRWATAYEQRHNSRKPAIEPGHRFGQLTVVALHHIYPIQSPQNTRSTLITGASTRQHIPGGPSKGRSASFRPTFAPLLPRRGRMRRRTERQYTAGYVGVIAVARESHAPLD